MNFIYIHLSPTYFGYENNQTWSFDQIPSYTIKSIKQTRKFNPDSNIFLICDEKMIPINDMETLKTYNVEIIHPDNCRPDQIETYIQQYNVKGKNRDAFWLITLLRYIYCEKLMRLKKLNEFLFVEGDNLLYTNFKEISDLLNSVYKNSMVTCFETAPGNCSSGIYYCNSLSELHKFNNTVPRLIEKYGTYVTDMSCIKMIYDMNIVNLKIFPGLPNSSNLIFDPSDWGFLIGGDNHKHENTFIAKDHIIGQFIIKNKDKIKIINDENGYYLIFDNKVYKFINLHIANKLNIDKFLKI